MKDETLRVNAQSESSVGIHFHVDPERFTLDDLIALDEADTMRPRQMRDLLARFVADANNQFTEEDAARAQLGKLTFAQLKQSLGQMSQSVKELKDLAVPPEPGSGS